MAIPRVCMELNTQLRAFIYVRGFPTHFKIHHVEAVNIPTRSQTVAALPSRDGALCCIFHTEVVVELVEPHRLTRLHNSYLAPPPLRRRRARRQVVTILESWWATAWMDSTQIILSATTDAWVCLCPYPQDLPRTTDSASNGVGAVEPNRGVAHRPKRRQSQPASR